MSKCKAIYSEGLSAPGNPRYVLIDPDTGELLDDAQGYGYKTPQKAHAAWAYKNKAPDDRRQEAAAKRRVQQWLDRYPEFRDKLENMVVLAYKEDEEIVVADVQKALDQFRFGDLSVTAEELFKYI